MKTLISQSLVINRVRDQARSTRSFDLFPKDAQDEHGVSFVPGQVAILEVPGEAPAYFAFASAPEDRELEVLVKRKVGTSAALFDLRPGDFVDLLSVAGHGFS